MSNLKKLLPLIILIVLVLPISVSAQFPTPYDDCPQVYPNDPAVPDTIASKMSKYNHCESNSDCVIIHGSICGFKSGTVVSRDDEKEARTLINSCRQDGCYEDGPGYSPRIGCVENKCRYLRPGEISVAGRLVTTPKWLSNMIDIKSGILSWLGAPIRWIVKPINKKF